MTVITRREAQRPRVSVIIPLHRDGVRFRDSLDRTVSHPSEAAFEVIVVTDEDEIQLPNSVLHVSTGEEGPTSPAVKRDVGAKVARGDLFAFIDDDAFPKEDWLDMALDSLASSGADGVGGPGITPRDSPWRERLGGAVYESWLGSGPLLERFRPVGAAHAADDLPAYNLVIRRQALEAIGGWASTFYGGEDTKVCLNLVKAGFHLRHDPRLIVYHYRRPVLLAHMQQVANVGRHRGFFVRAYPATSRRLLYFLPMLTTVMTVPMLVLLARTPIRLRKPILVGSAAAWSLLSATQVRRAGPGALLFPATLLAHHLAYGVGFLRGLFARQLDF